MRYRRPGLLQTLLIALIVVQLLPACSRPDDSPDSEEAGPTSVSGLEGIRVTAEMQQQLGIETGRAQLVQTYLITEAFGRLKADAHKLRELTSPLEGVLYPPANGRFPIIGSMVNPGEVIGILEPDLDGRQSWRDVILSYQESRESYERAQQLHAMDAMPSAEFRRREREYLVRKAGYEAFVNPVRSGLRLEEVNGELQLISVEAGMVERVAQTTGSRVQRGEMLLRLMDPAEISLEIMVYEEQLGQMEGSTAIDLHAGRERTVHFHEGQFEVISWNAGTDASGRRVRLLISLENHEGLRPGQPVRVRLRGEVDGERIVVPESALMDEGSHRALYVRKSEEEFERRIVNTGTGFDGLVPILSGLDEGEEVVTDGVYVLYLLSGNVQIDEDHDH